MISKEPDLPTKTSQPLTWKVWLPITLVAALLLAAIMFIILPGLWKIIFPPELSEETATLTLLNEINMAMVGFTTTHPNVSLESFFIDNEVNAGAKALCRCLVDNGHLREEMMHEHGHIVTDVDGKSMIVDAWGNPLVFIPKAAADRTFVYRNTDGETVSVRSREDLERFHYQLWSLGPNGRDDQGEADDLTLRPRRSGD